MQKFVRKKIPQKTKVLYLQQLIVQKTCEILCSERLALEVLS